MEGYTEIWTEGVGNFFLDPWRKMNDIKASESTKKACTPKSFKWCGALNHYVYYHLVDSNHYICYNLDLVVNMLSKTQAILAFLIYFQCLCDVHSPIGFIVSSSIYFYDKLKLLSFFICYFKLVFIFMSKCSQ